MTSTQYKIIARNLNVLKHNRDLTLAETKGTAARAHVEAHYSALITAEIMRVNTIVFAAK